MIDTIDITSETGDHVYVVEVLPVPLLMSDRGLQVIGHHAQVIVHIVHRVSPVSGDPHLLPRGLEHGRVVTEDVGTRGPGDRDNRGPVH